MYKGIIRKIEIFDSCSDIELRYIVVNMKTVIFLPLDEIIRQGDSGDSIYFLSRGSCDVLMKSEEQLFKEIEARKESKEKPKEADFKSQSYIRELKDGSYFGEIALITNLKRTCTVKAKEFCTLGFLSKRDFQNTQFEYPQIW